MKHQDKKHTDIIHEDKKHADIICEDKKHTDIVREDKKHDDKDFEEIFVRRVHRFKGNIINVETQYVTLPNGKEATRDVVLHPGAAAIVPISDDGEIYLVRQFRKPIDQMLLEIPAGKLDFIGEDPYTCALRELKEETGLTAKELKKVSSVFSCPGFCNEVLHIYIATGLSVGESCTDEDEFLSVIKYNINDLKKMIYEGSITDSKTIIGILAADRYLAGEF
jgi:ADP-ribose pyrophosphatase